MRKIGKWINNNMDVMELLDPHAFFAILWHCFDNSKRKDQSELKHDWDKYNQIYFGDQKVSKTSFQKIKKKIIEDFHNCKDIPGSKYSKKVGRMITLSFNIDTSQEGWYKKYQAMCANVEKTLKKYYNVLGFACHVNESTPGIHFFVGNYDLQRQQKGAFNSFHEKMKLSNREAFAAMRKAVDETIKQTCQELQLEYRQEPYTLKGLNRKIKQFKQKSEVFDELPVRIKQVVKKIEVPKIIEKTISVSDPRLINDRDKYLQQRDEFWHLLCQLPRSIFDPYTHKLNLSLLQKWAKDSHDYADYLMKLRNSHDYGGHSH